MNAIQQRSQFRKDYRSYKLGNEGLYVELLKNATYMLSEMGYTIDIIDGVYVLNNFDKVVASGVSGDYILEYVCRETFKYLEQDIEDLIEQINATPANIIIKSDLIPGVDKEALLAQLYSYLNRN